MTARAMHLLLGGTVMLLLALGVARLSAWPAWRVFPDDTALLRLSFTHSGDRSASCRERTAEELAALPPNMRNPLDCPRARPPVYVELDVDGRTVFARELLPTGLAGSGPSRIYRRVELPAGRHDIAVRMRDNPATEGFDHTSSREVTLAPAQSFVIDFRAELGFTFR